MRYLFKEIDGTDCFYKLLDDLLYYVPMNEL